MMHRNRASRRAPSTPCPPYADLPRATGFSLLELLIVIAIIGALLALALPALRGVHLRSKKTLELSNLRQVGMSWYLYAQSNNDHALPGYLDPEVQQAWDVTYDYPAVISTGSLLGSQIPQDIAAAWTWRLMPFLDDAGKILRFHLGDDDYEMLELIEHARDVALEPAFGYNGYYVGGYWSMSSGEKSHPAYRFASSTDANGKRVNVVARSPSGVRAADRLVVFCSTTLRDPGLYKRGPDNAPGFHFAVPPILADQPQWQTPGDTIAVNDSEQAPRLGTGDTYTVEALTLTPVPLGRYTGAAAVFYADGHTDSQTPGALADQSLWITGAERVGDTPAKLFTHSDH